MLEQVTQNLSPKKLFLLDALGALLSAFLLGVILVHFESYFGMPSDALYILAFLPCVFAVYDFVCYYKVTDNWRPFLRGIAVANLLYCFLSIALVFQHYQELTILGIIYFVLELLIVVVLAKIEWDQ